MLKWILFSLVTFALPTVLLAQGATEYFEDWDDNCFKYEAPTRTFFKKKCREPNSNWKKIQAKENFQGTQFIELDIAGGLNPAKRMVTVDPSTSQVTLYRRDQGVLRPIGSRSDRSPVATPSEKALEQASSPSFLAEPYCAPSQATLVCRRDVIVVCIDRQNLQKMDGYDSKNKTLDGADCAERDNVTRNQISLAGQGNKPESCIVPCTYAAARRYEGKGRISTEKLSQDLTATEKDLGIKADWRARWNDENRRREELAKVAPQPPKENVSDQTPAAVKPACDTKLNQFSAGENGGCWYAVTCKNKQDKVIEFWMLTRDFDDKNGYNFGRLTGEMSCKEKPTQMTGTMDEIKKKFLARPLDEACITNVDAEPICPAGKPEVKIADANPCDAFKANWRLQGAEQTKGGNKLSTSYCTNLTACADSLRGELKTCEATKADCSLSKCMDAVGKPADKRVRDAIENAGIRRVYANAQVMEKAANAVKFIDEVQHSFDVLKSNPNASVKDFAQKTKWDDFSKGFFVHLSAKDAKLYGEDKCKVITLKDMRAALAKLAGGSGYVSGDTLKSIDCLSRGITVYGANDIVVPSAMARVEPLKTNLGYLTQSMGQLVTKSAGQEDAKVPGAGSTLLEAMTKLPGANGQVPARVKAISKNPSAAESTDVAVIKAQASGCLNKANATANKMAGDLQTITLIQKYQDACSTAYGVAPSDPNAKGNSNGGSDKKAK